MEEYEFSDYSIFSDAISTTNSINDEISNAKSKLSSLKSALSSDTVFMGPIADSCVEALNEANTNMIITSDNFSKICGYLQTASSDYQIGDNNASNAVLDLNYGFNGNIASVVTGVQKKVVNNVTVASEYNSPNGISKEHLDFINSIKDGAVASYNEYGVLPSVTIAQAILESGWGQSSIGNNIFGIKAGDNWTGKVQNVPTYEQNPDGSSYQIYANFRDYDSIADSIKDHGKLFTQDFYQPVIDATNYVDACRAVKNCGYATAVDYADSLINVIESYGLNQWDPK